MCILLLSHVFYDDNYDMVLKVYKNSISVTINVWISYEAKKCMKCKEMQKLHRYWYHDFERVWNDLDIYIYIYTFNEIKLILIKKKLYLFYVVIWLSDSCINFFRLFLYLIKHIIDDLYTMLCFCF